MFVFWLAVVSLLAAVIHWLHWNLTKPIPGPWGWPVVFSLPNLIASTIRDDLLTSVWPPFFERYGEVVMIRLLGLGVFVSSLHSQDVRYILQDNFNNYPKPQMSQDLFSDLFGQGIFGVDGEAWLHQRKLASHAFKVNDIKHSLLMANQVTHEAIDLLARHNDLVVDMQVLAASMMLSAFSRMAMSMKLIDVGLELQEFSFHFNRILTSAVQSRLSNPFWQWTPWTKHERELAESLAFLKQHYLCVIAAARKREDDAPEDLLTPFLRDRSLDD